MEYRNALDASSILFGNATSEVLKALDEQTFLSVFEGVPRFELSKEQLPSDIIEMLAVTTSVFPSKGECRKMIQGGGLSINKEKVTDIAYTLTQDELLDSKYILVQKGKKNYYILKFE
jgi:tyrosyl-tRNA synthetase